MMRTSIFSDIQNAGGICSALRLSVAVGLFVCGCSAIRAQRVTPGSDSTNPDIPTTMEELSGTVINLSNYRDHISVGNGGSGSTSDGSAVNRVFMLYNVGARKFLTAGGFWGRHAVLSEVPHMFWLQDRNEDKSAHNDWLRYPEKGETLTSSATAYTKFVQLDGAKLKLGSQETDFGTSDATYHSVEIQKANGTTINLLEGMTTEGKDYQPGDKKFYLSQSLADLDLKNGDKLVATLDISNCQKHMKDEKTEAPTDLLSIGTDITLWQDKAGYNIHIYYKVSTDQFLIDYPRPDNNTDKQTMSAANIDKSNVVLTYDNSGVYINGKPVFSSPQYNYNVAYTEGRSGDIIKFKYADGAYVLDASGYLQPTDDEGGMPYKTMHDTYVYSGMDSAPADQPALFISQRIIKTSSSSDNVGKYLAFAPKVGLNIEGAIGAYTDRNVDSYTDGKAPRQLAAWHFLPTATAGVYKLALNTNYGADGEPSSEERTIYLAANRSVVHGTGNRYSAPQHYYYHQLDADGNWMQITDATDSDYTMVDFSEEAADDYSSWMLISLAEYAKLLGNTQDALEQPADLTHLISDFGFGRNSGALKSWGVKDGNLDSSETSYAAAKLRIGMEGYYKTSTDAQDYVSGLGASYDPTDNTDYVKNTDSSKSNLVNLYLSTHSRYLCATIQNGGYGKFYQSVPVYKTGWYIVSCQGMSTVGAKLYVSYNDNGEDVSASYPLTAISQADYNSMVCADAADAHWPIDSKMPMYNAAVWMNDPLVEAGQANIERYKNQIAIYVPSLESQDGQTQAFKTLEIGIEVPQTAVQTLNGNASARAAQTSVDFTAFDSFQLLYSGEEEDAQEKAKLVLNEEFTDLDYLDNTTDTYTDTELHLNRTFNANQWNTLVLPVSLTRSQFTSAFGDDAKLVKISKIEDRKLVFASETAASDDDEYLRAYKPYLIWTSKAHGDYPKEYGVLLNSKSQIQVSVPRNHFCIQGVTLKPHTASGYDFKNYAPCNQKWTYVSSTTADNATDGNLRTAVFYGTLCKTYEDKTILSGRPALDDGKSFYMKKGDNSNFYYRKQGSAYGLKGFRCWFVLDEGAALSSASYQIEINGVADQPTGIEGIDGGTVATGTVYNLSGQKVADNLRAADLPSGIYIVGGKKLVVGK